MANYATLKAAVQSVVKSNGNKEITGTNMQSTLLGMITSLASGYLFKGVATPSTSPGTPDENVFYLGGAGTYENFGTAYTVNVGSIGVFRYNGSWSRSQLKLYNGMDDKPTSGSTNLVSSGGIFDSIIKPNLAQITSYTTEAECYLAQNGELVTAAGTSNIVNTFTIDDGTDFYVDGRVVPQTIACLVAYYDENMSFLSYEVAGTSSAQLIKGYKLTLPTGTKYIRVAGQTSSANFPRLYNYMASAEIADDVRATISIPTVATDNGYYLLQDGTYQEITGGMWKVITYRYVDGFSNYKASGRVGNTTGGCSICYYDGDGNCIGFEKPFGSSGTGNYTDYLMTIPQGTAIIKIAGHTVNLTAVTTSRGLYNFTEYLYENAEEEQTSPLRGKTIAIIGASIETHGNSGDNPNAVEVTIMPEDVGVQLSAYITAQDVDAGLTINGTSYDTDNIGTEVTFVPSAADVGKVVGLARNYNSNTMSVWWTYVRDYFECDIIPVAWSGSGYTRNRQDQANEVPSYAWHESQIRTCGTRLSGTMSRKAPDIIFLCRGINDWSNSPYARITDGYFDDPNWQYPTSDLDGDGNYGFLEGLSLTIKELREAYPFAPIVLFTHPPVKRVNCSHYPSNNGLATQPQYNEAIRKAAEFFGCQLVDRARCAITWENMYPTYVSDSSVNPTHPNANGHRVIGEFVIDELKKLNFSV